MNKKLTLSLGILSVLFMMSIVSSLDLRAYGEYSCFGTDPNHDGFVNRDDMSVFSRNMGRTNCSISNEWCSSADFNRDRGVNLKDYLKLKENFGRNDCNYGKIVTIQPYIHDIPSDLVGSVKFSVSGKTANLSVDAMSLQGKRFTMNLPLTLIGGKSDVYGGAGSYMYGAWGNSFRTSSFKYTVNSAGNIDLSMTNGVILSIKNLKIV